MRYLRWLALAAAVIYLALAITVLAVSASEDNGDLLSTLLVVGVTPAAVGVYWWGLARPAGGRGQALRALGWCGMLVGSVVLISFSFVVWPLLLLAAPYSFLREPAEGLEGESNHLLVR